MSSLVAIFQKNSFLVGFLIGVAVCVLVIIFSRSVKRWFKNRAKLIRSYWIFVIIFSLAGAAAYLAVFRFAPSEKLDTAVNLTGQILGLIFAIFVGYFAFLQVAENRYEKLVEKAHDYFMAKEYRRAILGYEEALKINPKDFSSMAELAELYLIVRDQKKLETITTLLEKSLIEERERVILHYLRVANHLLQKHVGEAELEIAACIDYIKGRPKTLPCQWEFADFKKTDVYTNLDGESKKILQNFLRYLDSALTPDEQAMFKGGNYKLETVAAGAQLGI